MKGIRVCSNDKNEIDFLIILIIVIIGVLFFKNIKTSAQVTASQLPYDKILIDREQYQNYSEKNFQFSKSRGKTILFFAATTWCSNCVALEKDILKRIVDIPKDVTILKVDFDKDRSMVNQYKVTKQTTLILLESNEQEIKRWIGIDFDDILKKIN